MNQDLKQLQDNKKAVLYFDDPNNSIHYKHVYYCGHTRHDMNLEYNNIKDYFEGKENHFTFKEMDIKEIYNLIGQGFAIFPISDKWDIDLLKSYKEMNLKPVFMKASVFNQVRKLLKDLM